MLSPEQVCGSGQTFDRFSKVPERRTAARKPRQSSYLVSSVKLRPSGHSGSMLSSLISGEEEM